MTPLGLDLARTPFSRRGCYLALSRLPHGAETGLFLRTLHGDARERELLRLLLNGSADPEVVTFPGRLVLQEAGATTMLALDGSGRAVLRVQHGELALELQMRSAYDVVLRESEGVWRFIASGTNRNYRITVEGGRTQLQTGWDGVTDSSARLTVTTEEAATITIDEFAITPPIFEAAALDEIVAAAEDDYARWIEQHVAPSPDPARTRAARLAAYVTWSALVPSGGALKRESMLMSKNQMAHIWSWDHCFNAIGLAHDPEAAADQLLTLFDHQDAAGGLPDHIDDARVQPNFVKPPVHGWAVGYLMDRGGLSRAHLAELYGPLARWTQWWFEHRVYGTDGVPSYNHGNDSGWDNSTVFASGVPVQSPELLALLALQFSTLERLAELLGLPGSATWRERSQGCVELLLTHFWRDGRFVARDTLSGGEIVSDSLLTLMPLVLGERLPTAVFEACADRLCEGGYLTAHGVATEPPGSPYYLADGYWRGPVWAPTTMLLIDGLRRGGRNELATEIAENFLDTCTRSGMAENFDALTGEGLRDLSMTWTASVYLTLLRDGPGEAVVVPSH